MSTKNSLKGLLQWWGKGICCFFKIFNRIAANYCVYPRPKPYSY